MGIGLRHYRDIFTFDGKAHESSQTVHQVVAGGAPVAAQWRLIATGNFVGPASAGVSITSGSGNYNTLGGVDAGGDITTQDQNTGFGYKALEGVNSNASTGLGYLAGQKLKGAECVFIGAECAATLTGGSFDYNTGIGAYAFRDASAGSYNTGIGYACMQDINNNNADSNTAIGAYSASKLTSGLDNTFLGFSSGRNTTTGSYNVGVGKDTLRSTTAGIQENTAIGFLALTNCDGNYNTAVGSGALYKLDNGNRNTATGYAAGNNADFTSADSVFIGYKAGPTVAATITDRGYFHNDVSDTPLMSHDYANSRVGIGVTFANLTNVLTIQETSATDPLADAWDVYPSNRMSKHELGESSDLLDGFRAIKTYRYKRKAIVSENEVAQAGRKIATNELRAMGIKGSDLQLMDMNNLSAFLDTAALKKQLEEHKAGLPKFTTERVGMMIDDPEVPPEILIEYGDNGDKGISILGYIGYLHGVLRELAVEVQELKAQMG